MGQADPHSPEAVTEALAGVIRRQSNEKPSLVADFLEWLGENVGFDTVFNVWEGLFWIFLILLSVASAYFLARMLRPAWRPPGTGRESDPGPSVAERCAALLREAADARAAGDLRLALRKQLFALMLGLGGRGDLVYRDAWTNRELLRRGRPSPQVNALLAPLLSEYEAKEYGREPVSLEDLRRVEGLCATHLGSMLERAA